MTAPTPEPLPQSITDAVTAARDAGVPSVTVARVHGPASWKYLVRIRASSYYCVSVESALETILGAAERAAGDAAGKGAA